MRILFTSLFTLAMALFVGCTEQPVESQVSAELVNGHCLVMGGEITPEGGTVEWNNKLVGFCCPQCIDEWNALSDEEKTEALAHAGQEHSGHEHDAHSHEDHGGADQPESETPGENS